MLECASKKILPKRFEKIERTDKEIKIWVAGCSTGQEAYSLAILIDELCQKMKNPELTLRFYIQAMGISENALEIARIAHYNNFEINRGLSVSRRQQYF